MGARHEKQKTQKIRCSVTLFCFNAIMIIHIVLLIFNLYIKTFILFHITHHVEYWNCMPNFAGKTGILPFSVSVADIDIALSFFSSSDKLS